MNSIDATGRWPLASNRRLAHALLLVLLQVAVPLATVVAFHSRIHDASDELVPPSAGTLLAIALSGAAAVAVVVGLALCVAGKISLRALGWKREPWARALILGLGGAAACAGAVFLGIALFAGTDAARDGFAQVAGYAPSQRALFAIVGVCIALAEESLFRGYLQPTLAARIGLGPAIVVVALIYALDHFPHIRLVPVFIRLIQGLVYGALRGRDRSLVTPAIAHAVYWAIIGLL